MEQNLPMIIDIPCPAPRGKAGRRVARQGGAVLFFALIALVVMTLAAIALVRSVDTASLISGNLAFKQSAASSGDNGIEAAMAVLALPPNPVNTNLNVNAPASGYYNSLNRAIDLATLAWDNNNSVLVDGDPLTAGAQANDPAGNSVRYIIQPAGGGRQPVVRPSDHRIAGQLQPDRRDRHQFETGRGGAASARRGLADLPYYRPGSRAAQHRLLSPRLCLLRIAS